MMLLKSLRVKTLKIFEDCRMSGACGMLHVDILIATSYNILRSVYIPVGAVKGLCHSCCLFMPGNFLQYLQNCVHVHTFEDIVGSCFKDTNMPHSTQLDILHFSKVLSVLSLKLFNSITTTEVLW